MAPRLPNPLGGGAELVAALRVLPKIAENTRSMARDTKALGQLKQDIATVAERMDGVTRMDARMATIEAAMPMLVEIQQHLTLVPETLARLDERINKLSDQLDELAASVDALQRSIQPLGRIAGRFGGRGAKGDAKPDPDQPDLDAERDPRI